MLFDDRRDAGRQLADKLMKYAGRPNVIVLALPRGGVPVGFEVAQALHAPLDVFFVRKLGVPNQRELAFGAIASGGVRVLNDDIIQRAGVTTSDIEMTVNKEQKKLNRQKALYRGDRPEPDLKDKVVILIDDGLATGSSMRAAVAALRQLDPTRIVVGVPVGAASTCAEFDEADETICARTPEPFFAVGAWYEDFAQTTDDEVRGLLREAHTASWAAHAV